MTIQVQVTDSQTPTGRVGDFRVQTGKLKLLVDVDVDCEIDDDITVVVFCLFRRRRCCCLPPSLQGAASTKQGNVIRWLLVCIVKSVDDFRCSLGRKMSSEQCRGGPVGDYIVRGLVEEKKVPQN